MKNSSSTRTLALAAALLLQLGALCFHSRAAAGDVDLSFNAGLGVNSPVQVVAVQPDGKVLIGGPLTFINGTNRYGTARLNSDGSPDTTFVPASFDPAIGDLGVPSDPASIGDSVTLTAFALQPDGKVLVAGVATRWHCSEELGCINPDDFFFVTRHHADGSRDTNFAPALGNRFYGGGEVVRTLAVEAGGSILVGGYFHAVNGTNRNGLARLNANGTLDASSLLNIGGDYLFTVSALAAQPDGKFFIGGGRYNSDGSPDESFAAVGGVASLVLQPDGKVLVGGGFTTIHGTNRNRIARLNPDGSLDPSFNPGTGADATVRSIALQADGQVIIGGDFRAVNETNRNRVARLHANGTLDGGFDPEPALGPAPAALALQPDGKVLIGGPVVVGDAWFVPLSDEFTFVNGTNQQGRLRLTAKGRVDRGFVPSPFSPPLTAFYHTEDCLDDPRYGCSHGAVTTAHWVQADGRVLISGYSVTTITGDETFVQIPHAFLGRFNPGGSLESRFDHLTNAYEMNALAVQPDGKILVGGWFSQPGSNYGVIRLQVDGSVDGSFQLNQGPNFNYGDRVTCLALQSDGKVLIGGGFGLARLNSNGTREAGFNPALLNGAVNSVAVQPEGRILAGGSFTTVNGIGRSGIARINADGSLDGSFNPGGGVNGPVHSVVLQPDGNILIGGAFTTVNGVQRPYVARLHGAEVAPGLNITRSNALMTISWPSSAGFVLDRSLTTTGVWSQVAFPYTTNANVISFSTPAPTGNKFYRLRKL